MITLSLHRLQDGVRVIDMDNNAVNLNGMDQQEDRKMQPNLTELINQINVSLSTPAPTITSPLNTTSVIQKVSKPQDSSKYWSNVSLDYLTFILIYCLNQIITSTEPERQSR